VPYSIYAPNAGNAVTAGSVAAAGISGTIAASQLAANVLTNGATGVALAGTFSGNGGNLTGLNASAFASGTLPLAQLPSAVVTNGYAYAIMTNSVTAGGYQYGTPDYSEWPDGWNTWFADGIGVSEAGIAAAIAQMKAAGLDKLGFTTISMDEGVISNRDANGLPMMDGNKFPHGFPWLCHFIITNGFKVGIYAVVTNQVGLAADNNNYFIFGAEDVGANYFVTNGVTYFKIDAPLPLVQYGVSDWPNEAEYGTGRPLAPMANPWDASYYRFVTQVRNAASQPVFFNASAIFDMNGHIAPNIKYLLNSYRLTQNITTNSLGMHIVGGDMVGADKPLVFWNWAWLNAVDAGHLVGGWFFPDFDSEWGNLLSDAQSHFYAAAMFGDIFQFGTGGNPVFGSPYGGWSHNFTNEFGNPLLKQIRARQTTVRFMYQTNGCYIFAKDNRAGGLDVLALNENYTTIQGGNGSSTEQTSDPGYTGAQQYTNNFSYQGTNYQYVFCATNVFLDFNRLGLSSPNCIVTTVDNGGASVYATGGLNELMLAAGAELYTINPVTAFPQAAAGVRDLTREHFFQFYSTDAYTTEPVYGAFSGNPPKFGNTFVEGIQLGDRTGFVSWGINGATSFTTLTGVNGYGDRYGGQMTFLLDGVPVYQSPAITTGYTNLTISFAPTNQIFTIVFTNRNFLGNPQFNYGNYVLTASAGGSLLVTNGQPSVSFGGLTLSGGHLTGGTIGGNGAGLTNLNADAIAGGLTTNIVVTTPTGISTLYFTNGILRAVH
jgi:hypothetical protein